MPILLKLIRKYFHTNSFCTVLYILLLAEFVVVSYFPHIYFSLTFCHQLMLQSIILLSKKNVFPQFR